MLYKAKKNEIIDTEGNQIAIVLAVNCTKREAKMMAAYAAQQMNHEQRQKNRLLSDKQDVNNK